MFRELHDTETGPEFIPQGTLVRWIIHPFNHREYTRDPEDRDTRSRIGIVMNDLGGHISVMDTDSHGLISVGKDNPTLRIILPEIAQLIDDVVWYEMEENGGA